MSASDDQRREMARRLRSVTREELCYVFLEEILNFAVGGRCLDDEGDIDERLILRRLADLIDLPTCEYVPIGGERFGCSECGNTVRLDFDVPVTDETSMPFKYCPNCGARVVRKGADDDQ